MYKVIKEGKGGIVARIVADSVTVHGKRITTFEGEVHRSVWSEMMTHRLFSRNAMSSRAVPVKAMLENTNAKPIKWGSNQRGMQAGLECNNLVKLVEDGVLTTCSRDEAYEMWKEMNVEFATAFSDAGYHKGDVNRPLEAFQMMKFVVTATEFDNFFWLRKDSDAKEEIRELADCMYEALQESEPELLNVGDYHTPYVNHIRSEGVLYYVASDCGNFLNLDKGGLSLEKTLAISSSACAQVSYRNIDSSYDKALNIYKRLGVEGKGKLHASPFEHQATPMEYPVAEECAEMFHGLFGQQEGITHVDTDGNYWSGNFKGWVQHRQTLKNHTCYDYEEAIKAKEGDVT